MDIRVKLSLPDDLLAQLTAAPKVVPAIMRRWGKYMRATARDRIRNGEGMAPLAASTQKKYEVTRTSKVTAKGKIRADYGRQLASYFKASKLDADADELQQLRKGKSATTAAVTGASSKAITRLRKQLARYQTTGKRVGGNRRKIQKHKLLGKLAQAFTFDLFDGNKVVISNHVPWSGVHNQGGTVGNNATLPARKFLYFSPGNEARLAEIVEEELNPDA